MDSNRPRPIRILDNDDDDRHVRPKFSPMSQTSGRLQSWKLFTQILEYAGPIFPRKKSLLSAAISCSSARGYCRPIKAVTRSNNRHRLADSPRNRLDPFCPCLDKWCNPLRRPTRIMRSPILFVLDILIACLFRPGILYLSSILIDLTAFIGKLSLIWSDH